MAKKSKIAKTKRCEELIVKYAEKRGKLVAVIKSADASYEERRAAYRKLRKIPRDSSKTRYRNRCDVTGRPRGYMRAFRLSRIRFRDLALEGMLPGVTKSSW